MDNCCVFFFLQTKQKWLHQKDNDKLKQSAAALIALF